MTTAAVEKAPASKDAPVEPSISDVLYATESVEVDTPEPTVDSTPAQTQDTDSAPAAKADVTPPADGKQEPVAKAEEKPEEKDHVKEQLASQTAAARRLGKENAELKDKIATLMAQNEEILARANGTWKEPPKPSAEQAAREAEFRGREKAARPLAEQEFGADEVAQAIYAGKEAPFTVLTEQKPWLLVEVSEHPQPPVAAMKILRREAFIEKYGDDPRKWEEKILDAAKPKLFAEFKKTLETQPVGKDVPTVSTARNSGGGADARRERSLADTIYDGK